MEKSQAQFEVLAPIQYSEFGQEIKKFLHTPEGAKWGYEYGLSGFNKIQAEIRRFKRRHVEGVSLAKNEILQEVTINGETFMGVYNKEVEHLDTYNSRVNKGAALTASLMSGSSLGSISTPLPPIYIALSTATLTPAAGDTTLTSETAVSGLARALGTVGGYSAPAGLDAAASYTVSKVFTAGGSATIASAALFDAVSTGNLFVEGNLSASAVLASGDTLTITWTVNI